MIQDARYTSPRGKETTFEWELGKRKTELKTGVYTFPGRDGAHVQHQGAGARAFPLECIFSGDDCMEKASAFEAMLIERGAGELQHPTYGTVKVVPTGDIEREDDPVNKLGESIVKITFTETIVDEDGELTEVAVEAIEKNLDEFTEAAVADFAAAIVTNDTTKQKYIISVLNQQTQSIIDNLQRLSTINNKKFANWLTSVRELKDNIKKLYQKSIGIVGKLGDVYVKALNIGRLTLHIMKLPSTLSISLAEKIEGYSTLTADLINQYKNDPFGIEKMKAAYATASLAITGACAAIASGSALTIAEAAAMTGATPAAAKSLAIKNTGTNPNAGAASAGVSNAGGGVPAGKPTTANISAGIASRREAVETAAQIVNILEMTTEFQDAKITQLNIQNTEQTAFTKQDAFVDAAPTAHLALAELVHSSVQLILNAAFALPMQKTITLDRDRQVVELCAELYGSTDFLDNFITENNFNIDEIELLPMGKKVSYYVQSA